MPVLGDQVLGVVVDKLSDEYRVDVGGPTTANLPVLAFDGATARNRPALSLGALVFARLVVAHKDMEPELSCAAPPGVVSKDWTTGQSLYGELKGGAVFRCRLGVSASLLAGSEEGAMAEDLAALGARTPFELAVGANGRLWVNAGSVQDVVRVRNRLFELGAAAVRETSKPRGRGVANGPPADDS
mmetsp:Transcript_19164/g.64202  ORF Transcript_19164/g.64202 Transcript_19164/m.64202 type:complete len:186 (-) Transcript_19164:418-975(-)